jgi:hypothetical protein
LTSRAQPRDGPESFDAALREPEANGAEDRESKPSKPYRILQLCRAVAFSPPPARQPKILFLVIDNVGFGDLGCHGNAMNRTPNMERLAA